MNNSKIDNPATINDVIDLVQTQMLSLDADSEEFNTLNNQLEKLYKLKTTNKSFRVSPDTLAIIGGNLLGIALILGYERAHVVTSKALSFVMKTKV